MARGHSGRTDGFEFRQPHRVLRADRGIAPGLRDGLRGCAERHTICGRARQPAARAGELSSTPTRAIPGRIRCHRTRPSRAGRHRPATGTCSCSTRDNWKLYELYAAYVATDGSRWTAGSGAIFDLTSNALRPAGWTSADAAGLPIFPGLVRYDEVGDPPRHRARDPIHCVHTRKAYVPPARHWASTLTGANCHRWACACASRPASTSPSYSATKPGHSQGAQEVRDDSRATTARTCIIGGAPDPRWNDDDLHNLTHIHGSDFEVVQMNGMVTGH